MPPKKDTKADDKPKAKAADKPKAKSNDKPKAKSNDKPKAKATDKPKANTQHNTDKKDNEENPIGSAVVLLFTKCKDGVSLLLGKNNFEIPKWGVPGGLLNDKESPEDAMKREFTEETGHVFPKVSKQESTRFRNTMVFMVATDDCIEPKIGPKAKKPHELLELKHVPVKDIYKLLDNPSEKDPIRPVMISMMLDKKKEVESFMKGL